MVPGGQKATAVSSSGANAMVGISSQLQQLVDSIAADQALNSQQLGSKTRPLRPAIYAGWPTGKDTRPLFDNSDKSHGQYNTETVTQPPHSESSAAGRQHCPPTEAQGRDFQERHQQPGSDHNLRLSLPRFQTASPLAPPTTTISTTMVRGLSPTVPSRCQ